MKGKEDIIHFLLLNLFYFQMIDKCIVRIQYLSSNIILK